MNIPVFKIVCLSLTICLSTLCANEPPPAAKKVTHLEKKGDFAQSWLLFVTVGLMYLCIARVGANPGQNVTH